ncbi:MAG: hypothetical protein NVSMB6_27690 [Burkholderiaceae bacterium]
MKINDAAKNAPGLGVGTTPARAGNKSDTALSQSNNATDTVSLSSQSQALAGASAGNSVFDVSRVQEIKEAIASGRFQVDAGKVADGLIDTVKNLIRPSKG